MTDIAGMFGVDPNQLAMDRYRQMQQQNMQYAQLDPFQKASASMGDAGSMIGMMGAKAIGLTTHEEDVAKGRQQISSMINENDPESYVKAAQAANQMGDAPLAAKLMNEARSLKKEISAQTLQAAQTQKEVAMADSIPKQRHEEQLAKIEQASELAKQRSEDTRLGIEQRRQAAKDHNDLLKYLAEIKIGATTSSSTTGQNTVGNLTAGLRDYYSQLDESGAITNPDKSVMHNISAWASSTSGGQLVSGMAGTKVQAARDAISQQRPLLLQAIKQATGMSAKQMDSNTELQMYLKVATDPKLSVKANREALDKIDQLYGVGGIGIAKPASPSSSTSITIPSGMIDMNAVQAEIARRKGGK